MHLSETIELPADPHRAGLLLADLRYVHAKVRATGATELHVDVTGDPQGAFRVAVRRTLPSEQVPAHVRGLVGGSIEVRQVDAWEAPEADGSRVGSVVIEVAGAAVRLTGWASLTPTPGAGSVVRYEGELHAGVPLFGSAIEDAVARAIRTVLAVEAQVAADFLADNGSAEEP